MSNDESTDLAELFEYDEFDSYDSHTYRTIDEIQSACGINSGVPLSVELSQCLSTSIECSSTTSHTSNHDSFVKAPEIFLRIDHTNSGGGGGASNEAEASNSAESTQPIDDEQTKSIDSIDSCKDVILSTNRDQCIELQYEDEFIDSNDDENDYDSTNVAYERRNSIESDYEQLLFEGIFSQSNEISLNRFSIVIIGK